MSERTDDKWDPSTPANVAAEAFVQTMLPKADRMHEGFYPMWYGWALRDAFHEGAAFARSNGAAPSAKKQTDFEWLATFKCNHYHLTRDDEYAVNYVTAKKWIEEFQPKDFTDVDPVELQAMKDTNTIWCLHIYPNTPIMFYHWYGATLESVVRQAREHFDDASTDGKVA